MKNARLLFLCCILLVFVLPFYFKRYTPPPEKQKRYILEISDVENNKILKMDIEEYVLRVIEQEIPASYEPEAMKAQAVAIRSYALRKALSKAHSDCDLCTSFAHCMAYISEEDAKKKWGENYEKFNEKFKAAVNSTEGEVLTYNGEVANTVFFAMSSGKTQNSKDVWGGHIPYLQSVDSSVDENSENFISTKAFSRKEICEILNIKDFNIENTKRTNSGSVDFITISGKTFRGTEIRKLLALKSTDFEIFSENGYVTFKVKGNGHGVGMSQNGANEYAKLNMNYKDILAKYYKGTKISFIVDLSSK